MLKIPLAIAVVALVIALFAEIARQGLWLPYG